MLFIGVFFYLITYMGILVPSVISSKSNICVKSEQKKMVDGTFEDIVEFGAPYVDKTLLIKAITEINKKIILITCPRRWGKTVNLGMIRRFFEICLDKDFNAIPANETLKYKFFTQGKLIPKGTPAWYRKYKWRDRLETYITPPLIGQHRDIVDNYLGTHPVLYYTWWGSEICFKDLITKLRFDMGRLFSEYKFLIKRMRELVRVGKIRTYGNTSVHGQVINKLNLDIHDFQRYMEGWKALRRSDILVGFQFLSRIMYEQMGKEVIICMDEWIRPLENLLLSNRSKEESTIISFMLNFIRNSFNENPYVAKIILTGTISINKEDLFGHFIDDVAHFNVFHNDLQDFYGLTQSEADILYDYLKIREEKTTAVANFFKGYSMNRKTDEKVYNIWTIIRTVSNKIKALKNYWAISGKLNFADEWFKIQRFRDIWNSLIDDNDVLIEYMPTNVDHKKFLYNMTAIWGQDRETDRKATYFIFSYFFEMGYLTLSDDQRNKQLLSNPRMKRVYLRIPNEEIRLWMMRKLRVTRNTTIIF